MAAATAGAAGAKVGLVEKNERLGRKLGITGKGRCNITNVAPVSEYIASYCNNGKFMFGPLAAFTPEETMEWFAQRGVSLKVERGGRVFPESDKASEIVNALREDLRLHGVKLIRPHRVRKVEHFNEGLGYYLVELEQGEKLHARCLVIATGGMSYPATGATGDGYALAEVLGHQIVPVRGALVPLYAGLSVKELAGITLKNVSVSLQVGKKKSPAEFGDLLFTHKGFSGPTILTLTSWMSRDLSEKPKNIILHIDLKPGLSQEQLVQRLRRDIEAHPGMHCHNFLGMLMPKTLAEFCAKHWGLPEQTKVRQLSNETVSRIVEHLKDLQLPVAATAPIDEAIVTAGGVSVKEIDPRRMESKLMTGLFFAGEVIDVDGLTGGYNLQMCFSTGYLAGKSAAWASMTDKGAANARKDK